MKYYLWLGQLDLLDLVLAYTVLTSHLLSQKCHIQICVPKLTYGLQTPTLTLIRLNTIKQIKLKLALSSPSAHIPHFLTNQFLLVKFESYPVFPLENSLASLPKTRAGIVSQSKHNVPFLHTQHWNFKSTHAGFVGFVLLIALRFLMIS